MPLASGEQLGHYKIQSLIGKGGMGEVYRALDTKLEREVAIKVLPAALAASARRPTESTSRALMIKRTLRSSRSAIPQSPATGLWSR